MGGRCVPASWDSTDDPKAASHLTAEGCVAGPHGGSDHLGRLGEAPPAGRERLVHGHRAGEGEVVECPGLGGVGFDRLEAPLADVAQSVEEAKVIRGQEADGVGPVPGVGLIPGVAGQERIVGAEGQELSEFIDLAISWNSGDYRCRQSCAICRTGGVRASRRRTGVRSIA